MSQLNYSSYITETANMVPIGSTDPGFVTMLPGAIEYAEQRCYRELDLLQTQITDDSGQLTALDRNFTLPTSIGTFITVDQVNLITPAGTPSTSGSRVPLMAVSPEFIDVVYPSNTTRWAGQPKYYGRRSDDLIILGPAPNSSYYVEVIGVQRPQALSSANSSTPLTIYVPDLFFACSMIFVSGYMRNFGAQASDPQMSQSWEMQYKTLFQSASVEQARAKFHSEGWTSEQPSPTATPPRV